jgi:predicted acetyltransferase
VHELDRTFHPAEIDPQLVAALAEQRLEVRRADDGDRSQTDPWLDAVARGFLDGERSERHRAAFAELTAQRRKIGVHDPQAPDPAVPVATFASWGAELTLPGGTLPACAISSVTVAPTHRRRGLLRQVMAAELRTAKAHGFPMAMLTVSESGIYGRFGFGPAAVGAQWRLAVRRAGWVGPAAPGRLDFISRERGREIAPALHDRVRLGSPGEIEMPDGHWERFFGTRSDTEKAEEIRVVQYRSPEGDLEGLAAYRVRENDDDFAASTVRVELLLAATDDAYAGLWRFLLSMDLIGTIEASELAVDEPLWWLIADQRAASISLRDHQYLRILDVAASLTARRYPVADEVALEVSDPFGLAAGRFVLRTEPDGTAAVEAVDDLPPQVSVTRLGVAELSSLLLGGVSPVTLARAGRLVSDDPERLARLFATPAAPRLSFWY